MMNTKELRQLAKAATHPTTKGQWMRIPSERTVYVRMENSRRGAPIAGCSISELTLQNCACLDFIAAANPAAILELLNRLEAAENLLAGVSDQYEEEKTKARAFEQELEALKTALREIEWSNDSKWQADRARDVLGEQK